MDMLDNFWGVQSMPKKFESTGYSCLPRYRSSISDMRDAKHDMVKVEPLSDDVPASILPTFPPPPESEPIAIPKSTHPIYRYATSTAPIKCTKNEDVNLLPWSKIVNGRLPFMYSDHSSYYKPWHPRKTRVRTNTNTNTNRL